MAIDFKGFIGDIKSGVGKAKRKYDNKVKELNGAKMVPISKPTATPYKKNIRGLANAAVKVGNTISGAAEAAKNLNAARKGNKQSVKNIKDIVGKQMTKEGRSQSPENMMLYKKRVKDKRKHYDL